VKRPSIAVTLGDPRGIGPEVALAALRRFETAHGDVPVCLVGPDGPLDTLPRDASARAYVDGVDDDVAAGRASASSIERAVAMALSGDVDAIVTAPVHKPSLHAAGWDVPGQTELLGRLAGVERVGMLMAAERTRLGAPLRVLLATTHIALEQVAERVTTGLLVEQSRLLHEALSRRWLMARPRIAICAMNPHASDGGLFGSQEAEVFAPAVEALRSEGISVEGPLPADTVFSRTLAGAFDAVVAPYHDVGMAAFKTVAFGTGVNVTLGLPFVRTSPDHGTAFDIAGTGKADESSMYEALELAAKLSNVSFDSTPARV